ncbi:MAG TPA: response regulator, partial [Candidatus Dormibacteraeota bacterium]
MSAPRVLVVDDEPSITDFIALGLRHEGFEVRTAPDGRAALRVVDDFKPQNVVLDLMMPRMDGWELCRALAGDRNRGLIILSAPGRDHRPHPGAGAGGRRLPGQALRVRRAARPGARRAPPPPARPGPRGAHRRASLAALPRLSSTALDGALAGRESAAQVIDNASGEGQLVVALPVHASPSSRAAACLAAQLGTPMAPVDDVLTTDRNALLLGGGAVLVLALLAGLWLTERALGPLHRVTAT